MYPLSVYHNQALEKWMNNNPGRVVSVFLIFGEANLKPVVPINIIKAFEKCGIFLFNPDVTTDVEYAAARTTEQKEDNESLASRPPTSAVPDTIQFLLTPIKNTPSLISKRASPSVCEKV
ncbi:hypothetical protein JTB14_031606 [Gonioctena quinquepunctata]|nr:hypothetical protein JTB14_031606 [Gonioctena quinquepunctata]